MSKITLYATQLRKSFRMRVTLYAVGGVAAALVAFLASELLSGLFPFDVEASAIDDLLTIMASSMLAVTTFSVAALTTAYGGATSNGTARATGVVV